MFTETFIAPLEELPEYVSRSDSASSGTGRLIVTEGGEFDAVQTSGDLLSDGLMSVKVLAYSHSSGETIVVDLEARGITGTSDTASAQVIAYLNDAANLRGDYPPGNFVELDISPSMTEPALANYLYAYDPPMPFWLAMRIAGGQISAELWHSDPWDGGTPHAAYAAGFTPRPSYTFLAVSPGSGPVSRPGRVTASGDRSSIEVTDWKWGPLAPPPPSIKVTGGQRGAISFG